MTPLSSDSHAPTLQLPAVGFISDGVASKMEAIAEGESKVCASGHTLILGFNECTIRLVCQVAYLRRAFQVCLYLALGSEALVRRVCKAAPLRNRDPPSRTRRRYYVHAHATAATPRRRSHATAATRPPPRRRSHAIATKPPPTAGAKRAPRSLRFGPLATRGAVDATGQRTHRELPEQRSTDGMRSQSSLTHRLPTDRSSCVIITPKRRWTR